MWAIMEMTVCYEAAVAHARSRSPHPPPCILYVTQHFGPKYSQGATEDGSEEIVRGERKQYQRHQYRSVETCVVEWRGNMWDAAVEQTRAHLPREKRAKNLQ